VRLYRILDEDARRWWYHKELRRRGAVAEARRRERASIRHSLDTLREALAGGYLAIGRGGWTLHVSDNRRVEHYGGITAPTPRACLLLGIPVLDSTTVPDDRLVDLIRLPMVGIQRTSARPWGSLSFAPFGYVAARQVALGATLYVPDGWTDPDYLAEQSAAPETAA
jgi:hypothetical protein